ncbi:hypothetical protein AGR5A_Lc30017 [Agrobacterium genomosp. 5 str. CFBP 6626]|nr:hypothetical protein AGR5A_Lc30017 [Agrobacterium genomosp. 5 str. CFBP 6626]
MLPPPSLHFSVSLHDFCVPKRIGCSRPQIGHYIEVIPMYAFERLETEGCFNNSVIGSIPFTSRNINHYRRNQL